MLFNYHFLRHLTPALETKLVGWELLTAFSQSKDELVLGFGRPGEDFYLRADLSPKAYHLAFQDEFHRARRNSVDLFPEAIGRTVERVVQQQNERSFFLQLSGGVRLLFQLFGSRSNVLLVGAAGEVIDQFHRSHPVERVQVEDRAIDQSHAAFEASGGNLKTLYPTFGPLVRQSLEARGYAEASLEQKWALVQEVLAQLDASDFYVVRTDDQQIHLSLLETGEVLVHTTDPLEAANRYARYFTQEYYLEREKNAALATLERERKRAENYIEKTSAKLEELERESRYEEWGHILMANLHQIPERSREVTLYDFYHDRDLTLRLNPDLSPQKNAERFYRKAKNQQKELNQLRQNLDAKWERLSELESGIEHVKTLDQLKPLRKFLKDKGLTQEEQQQEESLPYKAFVYGGFQIWVGKHAKSNDELTQRHSYKEDLWLHARDVSGSHVLLKYQAGKPFPPPVIQKAAELAAWYSKRKTDSLCPVIYTPKKWVRKVKGAPPGQVIVEKESVLMVTPQPFEDK
ncbi:Predicted component of the ribosome quality control (RQC) complex, YloA/Tae2 family, contains fibronectin-binding (FbpA) and DUF814 domains [Catalinimonas alkaloidigena]|uniref:Predicted component of the ribosome quality control (RQC) complex, YloA/Tae2 family, contains fibronectin-binding (FbpA) and DUF814 domains n=1 Tax=Catalinimonas alkaloidigena TaxID=1075417 RepID=A0A1G9GTA5_9BACT|nr:NFACT RNA binding domain-containing protein [Catalinimonas alkaloidigena]SDL03513.1 Predicted component of the ribosome quality control (RQC) complex, YloA/Tae2 family, contains fibronectin-binding (FbpA) and DUF814 domains [Catalinimonas alkaloidigena]